MPRAMRILGALPAVVITVALAGCGDNHPQVTATLREWKVDLSLSTLTAGKSYDLKIRNAGTTDHELIAFKTELAPSALPRTAAGDVNEEASGLTKVTDGENIPKGRSQTRTVKLVQPGKYIFMCNLPGHFRQGMYQIITVQK